MHRCRGIARLVIRRYGLAHAFWFIYFFYRHVSAAISLSLTPFFVFSPAVRLPGERFDRCFLHDAGLPLPFRPCFGFGTIFEYPIAGRLAVAVRDDYAKVVMFAFGFLAVICLHHFRVCAAGFYHAR
jgi:hypothetical protein